MGCTWSGLSTQPNTGPCGFKLIAPEALRGLIFAECGRQKGRVGDSRHQATRETIEYVHTYQSHVEVHPQKGLEITTKPPLVTVSSTRARQCDWIQEDRSIELVSLP